ncbi:MAG: TetR/AcrR family transcriptional regulator [Segniliparus sp.]|uniref:TetR/AcrR family transcriptional regulator n=1 Tax=Segniliparus sp. TaxID=2804064 RepID=UPI003F2B50B1
MSTIQAQQLGLRERKRAACAAQIHEAAVRLVAEHGHDAVTVAHIAEAAEVSPKTVFNYWGSKDGAILGIPTQGPDPAWAEAYLAPQTTDPFRPLVDSFATQAEGRTQAHAQRMLEVFRANPHLAGLRFAYVHQLGEELAALCAQKLRQLRPEHSEAEALSKARLFVGFAMAITRHAWQEWAASGNRRPMREHLADSLALHKTLCAEFLDSPDSYETPGGNP